MNNNVVEKTLKSIDNIDRLSDLAAISIYNTSHEAIDKFDVMQEHATPEYVEGEFVQESLLTGVLIGAGIIGVAISAFLIIKKIIESKAKGDPNAAPNTVAGVNLINPEEIKKLFDGWNDKYFKNHPDLVAEDVPGADVSELNTYNGVLLGSIRTFCDNATKMIDGLNELSDADMKEAIDNLNKEFDSNINMDELVSKTGRVDKNTILQIKAASEDISKTLREFDAQVTNCIKEFRNQEKNNQNSGSDNEENKISEENIKLLEKALKAKANTAGTIMDNFRNKCLNGIAQALDAKVKEAEGQAKAKQQQELTPLTDDDKQTIIKSCVNLIKSGYEYSDEDISHYVKTHHTASPEEIQEIINAVRAETNESPKEPTGGPESGHNSSQDDESTNRETNGSSAETETPEGTPKAEPATAGESEEGSDDYDPTQYIDKNRAEEVAARESTEEFDDDSSDGSAKQSTSEQSENAEKKGETSSAEETTVTPETPERADKVNITPEMEEKMKEVLLSAGEISQYGVIDENVVNHEIRQIKDMGLFKWTSSQYGNPNNVMSGQQDQCIKINNARYDAAYNLAEVMGIDPQLVPKPIPLKQKKTALDDDALKTAYADKYFNGDKDKAFKELDRLANYSSRGLKSRIIQGALYKLEFNGNISAIPENIKKVYTEYENKFNTANIPMPVKSADDVLSSDNLEKLKEIIELTFGAISDNLFVTMMASIFGLDDTAKIDQVIESLKEGRPYYWPEDPSINIDQKSKLADIITKFISNGLSLGLEGEEATKSFGTMQVPNIINLGLVKWAEQQYAKKPEYANNVYRAACEMATALQIVSRVIPKPGNNGTPTEPKTPETSTNPENKTSAKTDETSNAKLFTDEEEDKIVDAIYAVTGLDRKFRQEIYNAVTDGGFAEAAKKLYAKYADDANKLNQIHTTLIAMAKSISKESEVPDLPTTEATPTESETPAENQTPEQTETPTETPEGTPEAETPSDTAPGVVTDNEELKKIADDLGLPLSNFIAAYDKVKEGNADYTESQMLTTVFNNQIAFNQFTLPAINEAIAKEYDKCKQVADAVHAPFDVEPITIDDATFKKLYAYFDQKNKSVTNMETAKLIPGALADMAMQEMRSSEIISPEDAAEKNITTPAFEKITSNHVTPSDSPSNSSTGSGSGAKQ